MFNTAKARTKRVFMSGRSQHVTIPQAYRLRSNVVSIQRDPESGDLILSEIKPLAVVFVALDSAPFPEGFLSEADRDRRPPQARPAVDAILMMTPRRTGKSNDSHLLARYSYL
jgi:virulence-associated protein VagC